MQTSAEHWIRIPKLFIDDHSDRGLDTPTIQKATARHYWIDPSDWNMPELVDDAVYYAYDVDGCERGLIASARATLNALRDTPNACWKVRP